MPNDNQEAPLGAIPPAEQCPRCGYWTSFPHFGECPDPTVQSTEAAAATGSRLVGTAARRAGTPTTGAERSPPPEEHDAAARCNVDGCRICSPAEEHDTDAGCGAHGCQTCYPGEGR